MKPIVMHKFYYQFPKIFSCLLLILLITSCSKSGSSAPEDPCANITITVNGTVVNSSGTGTTTGSITASAGGASGFTYSLNNGPFQNSGVFSNLAAGDYTIRAKTAAGCIGSGTFTVNNEDPCTGQNITVTTLIEKSDKCGPTGKVTISATGGANYQYKLNAGGTYQDGNIFENIASGDHVVYVKTGTGCETTSEITIEDFDNGPLFTAVNSLIASKCATCHSGTNPPSGIRLDIECNVVERKNAIKTQAVDLENMPKGGPPLSAADKKIITDWINAGGLARH